MRTIAALLTAACALGGAAAAQAKPVHYKGKTKAGDAISFTVKRGHVSKVVAEVPALCASPDGGPRAGTSNFDPPGAFKLGHKGKAKAKRDNELGITSAVTKNFTLSTHRAKHGAIKGKAHVDWSFLEVQYTYPISAKTFVCTGDDSFTAHPVA